MQPPRPPDRPVVSFSLDLNEDRTSSCSFRLPVAPARDADAAAPPPARPLAERISSGLRSNVSVRPSVRPTAAAAFAPVQALTVLTDAMNVPCNCNQHRWRNPQS